MSFVETMKSQVPSNAHSVAHAALVLAERAYADGNSEEAAYLVDVAHRLFDTLFERSPCTVALSH